MTLPEDFVKYTKGLFGEELWKKFLDGMQQQPPVSVRMNPFKFDAAKMELPAEVAAPVEWCGDGVYLKERPLFTFDPLLHAGAYYVQEAASMYVTTVLRNFAPIDKPLRVLDLCAAPGGKSTAVRSVLAEDSLLMSNEPVRTRANILVENIQKFGHPDVVVTNNYAIDYQKSGLQFDVIIADVPCSGEGMFRKDEGAIGEWSVANVRKCASLQREIIADIMPCLRDGGLLVYSTCTFNAHEDEENVDFIKQEWNMECLDMRHFIPGETRTEGLFMAALRKPGELQPVMAAIKEKKKSKKQKGGKSNSQAVAGAKTVAGWISDSGNYDIVMLGGRINAVKKSWRDVFDLAESKLRVMHAGVELGEQKGKDVIPSECLALSKSLERNAFPIVDVDKDTAVSYLRKDPVTLLPDVSRGFVIIAYKGLPLGFVKNLGNRTNNMFPQEWRIRKSI